MGKKQYVLRIGSAAKRDIKGLDKIAQLLVKKLVEPLRVDPYPAGCKKLRGCKDIWRVSDGSLRLAYRVNKSEIEIIVLRVGDRKEIYKLLAQIAKGRK